MPSPNRSHRSDAPAAFLAGALVAGLHPLRFGYQFGTGDHDDLLPPILARMEPGLFALDAYVQTQAHGVTVRTAFQTLVRTLSWAVPLPTAVGALHVLVALGVGAGIYMLARALRAGRTASVLATVLACVIVPGATIGGNAVIYSLLAPEGIAWALILPALVLFAKKHRLASAVVLGVAAWFHLLAAGLVAGALVLVIVAETTFWRDDWSKPLSFGALTGVVAAPIAIPVLLRQSAEAGARLPDGLDPFTLYAVLRFPHHYLPSGTGQKTWALFLLVAVLGVWGYIVARGTRRPPNVRFPARFGAVAVVLMGLAMIAIGAADSLSAARAQTFKLTVLLNVLACIGIAAGATPRMLRKSTDHFLRRRPRQVILSGVLLLGVGIALRWTPSPRPAASAARWAFENTPRQTVFAVPPSLSAFRVPARRSVVATWKAVPFRTDLAADWWTRITALAPLDEIPARGDGLLEALDAAYARQTDDERRALAARFEVDYAVVPSGVETELDVVHEDRRWKVLRLR